MSVYVAIVYVYTYIYISLPFDHFFTSWAVRKKTAKFWRSWSFEENWQSDSERFLAERWWFVKIRRKNQLIWRRFPHFSDGFIEKPGS